MKYLVDIDGVLCENGEYQDYANAIPKKHNIESINKLSQDNDIVIYTSRLVKDKNITVKWLKDNNIKFNKIIFEKPVADVYIDDKAFRYLPYFNDKDNRKTLAIGISGGMDSYIAYYYAIKELKIPKKEILLINFDLGHPYAKKEQKVLKSLGLKYISFKLNLLRKELGNMPDEKKYIIPGRNMIFASIMAGFAKRIWIVGMKYENHYLMFDKNDAFFNLSSIALSQAIGSNTIVETPFRNMTKTDIIRWAVKNKVKNISKTTSCYNPTKLRCGKCSLCFKRYIAMKSNGIDEEYSSNPLESEEAKRLVKAYKKALKEKDFSHYQKDRIIETLKIIKQL